MSTEPPPFDPIRILEAFERHRVAYVLIGAFAGVIHGTDEITSGVDVCPQLKPANLERLNAALVELDARQPRRKSAGFDADRVAADGVIRLESVAGEIKIVPEPSGTSGYDDLRRKATREPIGGGLRTSVVSVADLARILSARNRSTDASRVELLRRLDEIVRARGISH